MCGEQLASDEPVNKLWLVIAGATLGGGVHDAVILFASMRRNGKSLGQMRKEQLNPFIGLVAMIQWEQISWQGDR